MGFSSGEQAPPSQGRIHVQGSTASAGGDWTEGLNRPDNHLVKAILVTLFCCLPLGIVSIINAAKVESTWDRGDHAEAVRVAKQADQFANWGIAAGFIVGIFYFIVMLSAGLSGV